jgi:YebC/PmpR family DNA-binding regulatory protein
MRRERASTVSGHSKWATTKHRKAAQDKKRSALFSKLSRAITVAAKEGGDPNPENNASLATAIDKAKSYSLPKDKIEAAIQKAFSAGEGEAFESVVYEGYGPAGVAVYVDALTDNRNRTAADVRSIFTRSGGNLASTGAVAFQFERKGQIVVERADAPDEEELLLIVMEAGGDDLDEGEAEWVVTTSSAELMSVRRAIEEAGVATRGAELVMEPTNPTIVPPEDAKKVIRLVDSLEELDDVQTVYHNLEFTEELAAALDE